MKQISSRELRLLFVALALGGFTLLHVGVFRPLMRDMRRLNTKLRLTNLDLQHIDSVLARRRQVESAYGAIRNRITSTRKPEQEIIEILLTVQKAARDAGVEILENAHVKDEQSTYFTVHTIHFRGRGETENLVRMIYVLQDPHLLLKIPRMEFSIKNYKLEMSLEITRVACEAETDGKAT